MVSVLGYGDGTMAPGIKGSGTKDYIVTHNLIKAHAKAYHIYDKEFRSTQQGKPFFTSLETVILPLYERII